MKCKIDTETLMQKQVCFELDETGPSWDAREWAKYTNKEFDWRINSKNPFTQIDVFIEGRWATFWMPYIIILIDGKAIHHKDCPSPD